VTFYSKPWVSIFPFHLYTENLYPALEFFLIISRGVVWPESQHLTLSPTLNIYTKRLFQSLGRWKNFNHLSLLVSFFRTPRKAKKWATFEVRFSLQSIYFGPAGQKVIYHRLIVFFFFFAFALCSISGVSTTRTFNGLFSLMKQAYINMG